MLTDFNFDFYQFFLTFQSNVPINISWSGMLDQTNFLNSNLYFSSSIL